MADEITPQPEIQAATPPATAKAEGKPAAKKAKEPSLEDKPFGEFIEQHYVPALKKALGDEGIADLQLSFQQAKLPLTGTTSVYWQVAGSWQRGKRQFNLYFLDGDINGKKAFSCATNGVQPSTLESFMIDERKVNLDLLLRYTLQRLNGQKWLTRN